MVGEQDSSEVVWNRERVGVGRASARVELVVMEEEERILRIHHRSRALFR